MTKEKILSDLKGAFKNGETLKVSVLRMFLSAIKNKEIEKMKKDEGLSEEEIMEVFKKEIKNRKKSIESFEKGGRPDLVEKEKSELEILNKYLPQEI